MNNEVEYKFEISTDSSHIEILADSYEQALEKIKDELKIPPEFTQNYFLERITVIEHRPISLE